MNDDVFEQQVRETANRIARGEASQSLRARVAAIPLEHPRPGRRHVGASLRLAGALGAVAVVAAIVVLLVSTLPRNAAVVPAATGTPTTTATPFAGITPTTQSVLRGVAGAWSGIEWSAPTAWPDALLVSGVVAWHGRLFAIGQVQVGLGSETAVWRSADGAAWEKMVQGGSAFADAGILNMLATPSGLVAWGAGGGPVCNGQAAGATCSPAPQMVWTSNDGATWTRASDVSAFGGGLIQGMASGPGGLVAVGDTGWDSPAVWASATGETWHREPNGPVFADAHVWGIRAAGPGYVIAGGTGTQFVSVTGGPGGNVPVHAAFWWSPDGRNWSRGTIAPPAGGAYAGQIAVGADGMIAEGAATGGRDGAAWTSVDGKAWTPVAGAAADAAPDVLPPQSSFTLIDDGTHIVAIGYGDRHAATWWASRDGRTWKPLALSGATGTDPVWQGDAADAHRWLDRAFVVPGGLIAVGPETGTAVASGHVWVASATP